MKNLLIIAAVLVGFSNTAFAHKSVEESERILTGRLVEFNTTQQWLGNVYEGAVAINLTEETVSLSLTSGPNCQPDLVCISIAPETHNIKLNLVAVEQASCGAIEYIAERDKTPADGLLETIRVVDNRFMTCEIPLVHITSVSYSTYNPWTNETLVSHFGGDALFMLPVFFQ